MWTNTTRTSEVLAYYTNLYDSVDVLRKENCLNKYPIVLTKPESILDLYLSEKDKKKFIICLAVDPSNFLQ